MTEQAELLLKMARTGLTDSEIKRGLELGVIKVKPLALQDFKEIIGEFVSDNFRVRSRDENAEIVVDDYKGSYDKSIKKLKERLGLKWL